jgi:hypothetical protein
MIGNRRIFSLAVMAMFALSALLAQGASATPLTVEGIAVGGTVFMTGDQDGGTAVYKSAGGSISCVEGTGTSSAVVGAGGAVNEVTGTANAPTEKAGGGNNCTAFGFAGAHVKQNECTGTSTTGTSIKPGEVTWSAATQGHLLCPTGKQIEITPTAFGASLCTQSIAPQTGTGGHVVGRNAGTAGAMDITLESTLTGVHYTGTGSSCGNSETHTDGSITGNSTVKCYSDVTHTVRVGCTFS